MRHPIFFHAWLLDEPILLHFIVVNLGVVCLNTRRPGEGRKLCRCNCRTEILARNNFKAETSIQPSIPLHFPDFGAITEQLLARRTLVSTLHDIFCCEIRCVCDIDCFVPGGPPAHWGGVTFLAIEVWDS